MRTTARRFGMLLGATALTLALAAPTAAAEPRTTTHDYPCWDDIGLTLLLEPTLVVDAHLWWDAEHGC